MAQDPGARFAALASNDCGDHCVQESATAVAEGRYSPCLLTPSQGGPRRSGLVPEEYALSAVRSGARAKTAAENTDVTRLRRAGSDGFPAAGAT
jgi:hypothetical protein